MSMNRMALSDDALDQVTGGTIIPHIVMAGESIASIAAKMHVDKDLLAKWNNLSPDAILKVGDKLDVYY